jgi:hypothetical protein
VRQLFAAGDEVGSRFCRFAACDIVALRAAEFQRHAEAVRLAPGVGDNATAFAAFGKTVLDAIARGRGDHECAGFSSGRRDWNRYEESDRKRREQCTETKRRKSHVLSLGPNK